MKLATLARGVVLYTIGNLVPRVGLFLLLPIYVTFMTPAEFGAMSLLVSVASLLAIFYRLGLDTALLRLHFDSHGNELARLYVSVAAATLVVVVIASVVIGTFVGPFFSQFFVGISFIPYGLLTLAIAGATTFQFLPTVWMRAREQPGRYLLFSISTFTATACVAVLLLVVFRGGLLGGLLAQLAAGVVTVGTALVILLKLPRVSVSGDALRPAFRFAIPLIPHQLGAWVLNVSDRLLIGLWTGLPAMQAQAAIGVYSLGYQIGNAIGLLALSVQAAWTPILYRYGEREEAPRLHREMFTVSSSLFFTLAVATSVLAPDIIALIAPATYSRAVDVLRVVAFGAALYGCYVMLVGVIMLSRRTGLLPIITVAAALANISVNFVLLPRIGILGAAWATLIAFGLYAVATYAYASSCFPLALDLPRLSVLIAASVVVALGSAAMPTDATLTGAALHATIAFGFAVFGLVLAWPAIGRLATVAKGLTEGPTADA